MLVSTGLMNNECDMVSRKPAVDLVQACRHGLNSSTEDLKQDARLTSRDLNQGTSEYKPEVLTFGC
jgi:hypothetical protein